MNNRGSLLRKERKHNDYESWSAYKSKRNLYTNLVKKAKSKYCQDQLIENANQPKDIWRTIKSVFPLKSKSCPSTPAFIEDVNLKSKSSVPVEKANIFCRFFSNCATALKQKFMPTQNHTWRQSKSIPMKTQSKFKFQYISKVFVEKQFKKLYINKSAGLDNLPPKLLKDSAIVISKPLSYLYNLSLKTANIPTEWKYAKIIPLHKAESNTNVDNYRPISILPIISKILEKAVHVQLNEFIEKNNLISNKQFGYRSKCSTELVATFLIDKYT